MLGSTWERPLTQDAFVFVHPAETGSSTASSKVFRPLGERFSYPRLRLCNMIGALHAIADDHRPRDWPLPATGASWRRRIT